MLSLIYIYIFKNFFKVMTMPYHSLPYPKKQKKNNKFKPWTTTFTFFTTLIFNVTLSLFLHCSINPVQQWPASSVTFHIVKSSWIKTVLISLTLILKYGWNSCFIPEGYKVSYSVTFNMKWSLAIYWLFCSHVNCYRQLVLVIVLVTNLEKLNCVEICTQEKTNTTKNLTILWVS